MPAPTTCQALADKAWNAQYSSPRDSHAWASEALAEAEQCGDAACKALAHLTIGNFQLRYESPDEAQLSLKRAEGEFTALADDRGATLARTGLARVRMMQGDAKGAYDMYRAILEEEAGTLAPLDRFYVLNGIAGCCAALGDAPQSIGYLFEALGQVRTHNARLLESTARAIAESIEGKTVLLVASTDLSHFYNENEANSLDSTMLQNMTANSPEGVLKAERCGEGFACGAGAVALMLWTSRFLGSSQVTLLHHSTSADASGDSSRVVGYGALAVTR